MTELEPAELTTRPEQAEPATASAELREADFRGCRFIAGEATPLRPGLFCGSPTLRGSSWCQRHHGVVWRSAPRRSTALRKSGAPKPPKPLN
jgi:hypothetical protein